MPLPALGLLGDSFPTTTAGGSVVTLTSFCMHRDHRDNSDPPDATGITTLSGGPGGHVDLDGSSDCFPIPQPASYRRGCPFVCRRVVVRGGPGLSVSAIPRTSRSNQCLSGFGRAELWLVEESRRPSSWVATDEPSNPYIP